MSDQNTTDIMTEGKFFHIIAIAFGAIFLGLLGYFAYTIQDSQKSLVGIAHDVSAIKDSMNENFGQIGKREDADEIAIKDLDDRIRTVEIKGGR